MYRVFIVIGIVSVFTPPDRKSIVSNTRDADYPFSCLINEKLLVLNIMSTHYMLWKTIISKSTRLIWQDNF